MNDIQIQGKIVYTVDDDSAVLELIQAMLAQSDLVVVPFLSGETMLANIHRQLPDLILLDIDMPTGMDGFEVCSQLKSEKTLKNIPVVFLSGSADSVNRVKAFDMGGKDYIPKPVLRGELIARVKTHLVSSQLENELKISKGKYKSMMESMIDSVYIISSEGIIEYMNPTMISRFGDNGVGKLCHKILQGSDEPCEWCDIGKTFKNDSIDTHFVCPIDERRYHMSQMPINHENGQISTMVIMRDETEYWNAIKSKENSERELMQAQKIKSIGQLAAGIAHEINTPIQYIRDNMSFLKDAFKEFMTLAKKTDELLGAVKSDSVSTDMIEIFETTLEDADLEYHEDELPLAIDQSIDGADRIANIVQSMKEFSRPGREKVLTDINHCLENTITISKNEWKYVSDVTYEFDEKLPHILCQPNEINQVLLNLVLNASQAIEEAIGSEPEDKGNIHIKTQYTDKWIQILFTDTGAGISIENQDHIFDPFFTTKEVGKGTGQGLSVAYDIIVKKHNGKIECTSEPGKGAMFVISLPIS